MARDSLYSNSPRSSRTGEAWVYQDGELYHYGRKGMKWGKNIFGGIDNPKSLLYDPNYGKGKIRGGLKEDVQKYGSNAWQSVKDYGSNVGKRIGEYGSNIGKRVKKGYNDFAANTRYDARQEFQSNVHEQDRHNFSDTNVGFLDRVRAKELEDGKKAVQKMTDNPTLINAFNVMFQNAQYNVVSAVDDLLEKLDIGGKVTDFFNKYSLFTKKPRIKDKPGTNAPGSNNGNSGGGVSSKPGAYLEGQGSGNTNSNAAASKINGENVWGFDSGNASRIWDSVKDGVSDIGDWIVDMVTPDNNATGVKPGDNVRGKRKH